MSICIFLFESQNYTYPTERERISCCFWFIPKISALARTGPSQRREPKISSGSLIWVTVPKQLVHLPLFFLGQLDLDQKWGGWNTKQRPFETLGSQVAALSAIPKCWLQEKNHFLTAHGKGKCDNFHRGLWILWYMYTCLLILI